MNAIGPFFGYTTTLETPWHFKIGKEMNMSTAEERRLQLTNVQSAILSNGNGSV
jgi:hypothetical protein